eukprot:Gb_16984 [translate_table: standard]
MLLLIMLCCSSLGTAFFASTIRPSMVCFSKTTVSATAGSAKTTKPNPRARPVILSFMMTVSTTSPNTLKYSLSRSSVVSHDMPPMKSFPWSESMVQHFKIRATHQLVSAPKTADLMKLVGFWR